MLAGAGAVSLSAAATLLSAGPVAASSGSGSGAASTGGAAGARNGLGFTAIAPVPSTVDGVSVPSGFTWSTLISWGDPILPGAPDFDFERQSAHAQARQFGYNNDFTALLTTSSREGLLVCNHEYTNESLMYRGWVDDASAEVEQLRISMAAHGLSVVEVSRRGADQPWRHHRHGRKNRRITAHTPFRITGPAAGSRYLRTTADSRGTKVLGTLNNCSGGVTPWGTILSGEENFHQYFRMTDVPADARPRPGISGTALPSAAAGTGTGPTAGSTPASSPTNRTASVGWSRSIRTTPPQSRRNTRPWAGSSMRPRTSGSRTTDGRWLISVTTKNSTTSINSSPRSATGPVPPAEPSGTT